jgi:hypothetical protein
MSHFKFPKLFAEIEMKQILNQKCKQWLETEDHQNSNIAYRCWITHTGRDAYDFQNLPNK